MMLPDQKTEHCPVCEQAIPEGSGLPVNLQVSLTSGKMLTSSYVDDVQMVDGASPPYVIIRQTHGRAVMYIPLSSVQWMSWTPPAEEEWLHG